MHHTSINHFHNQPASCVSHSRRQNETSSAFASVVNCSRKIYYIFRLSSSDLRPYGIRPSDHVVILLIIVGQRHQDDGNHRCLTQLFTVCREKLSPYVLFLLYGAKSTSNWEFWHVSNWFVRVESSGCGSGSVAAKLAGSLHDAGTTQPFPRPPPSLRDYKNGSLKKP